MATPIPGTPVREPSSDPSDDRRRAGRRNARTIVVALVALGAVLIAIDIIRQPVDEHRPAADPATAAARPPVPTRAPTTEPSPHHDGPGVFSTAAAGGPALGKGAELRRFHVAVEKGIGLDLAPFAASVDAILGDPRSWIADGKLRLQRIGGGEPADFTVYLATAGTSERMCATGGLDTDGYTSCQLAGQVIINADRWLGAVPDFDAPLAEYQAYAINHEVGHELGHQHEACPAPGAAAPVMQQQTLGMQGCVPNGWPYLAGARHTGPPIP